jgi:hypothetical protein
MTEDRLNSVFTTRRRAGEAAESRPMDEPHVPLDRL